MNFDEIPEEIEESYSCECGGSITQSLYNLDALLRSKSGKAMLDNNYMMIWECDRCEFEKAVKN